MSVNNVKKKQKTIIYLLYCRIYANELLLCVNIYFLPHFYIACNNFSMKICLNDLYGCMTIWQNYHVGNFLQPCKINEYCKKKKTENIKVCFSPFNAKVKLT